MEENECVFTLDDYDANAWRCSRCFLLWVLNEGSPKENTLFYCPRCGGKIVEYNTDIIIDDDE